MGRRDDPPSLHLPPEAYYPSRRTQEGRATILRLYELWGSNQEAKARLMQVFGFKTLKAVKKYLQRARRKTGIKKTADNKKTADKKRATRVTAEDGWIEEW
jgi:hypothetical protein